MIVASPAKLAMLCRVLNEAHTEAKRHRPKPSDADEHMLKLQLARLIIDAYHDGESEPDMLKRLALGRLTLEESLIYH